MVRIFAAAFVCFAGPRLVTAERGIGLTEEERSSVKDELAAEEAKRFAAPIEDKEAKARAELAKLNAKMAKRPKGEGRKWKKAQTAQTVDKVAPNADAEKVRGIGLTDAERNAARVELEAEEERRFNEPQQSKEERARREMEKLNKKTRKSKGKKVRGRQAKKAKAPKAPKKAAKSPPREKKAKTRRSKSEL